MKVIDADGRFVGFVKQIQDQKLVIGRPSAADIQVPMAACQMSTDKVKLNVSGDELTEMDTSH